MTTIVRRTQPDDDGLADLRSQVAELETVRGVRATEIDTVRAELESFRLRYRQEVGLLHEQLDALELAIAEAELGELSRKLAGADSNPGPPAAGVPPEPQPRYTSDAVRRLFRDVARTIHPDLARDEATRGRRHALMVQANRAYAQGDEDQLRLILQAWEKGPDAVQGTDPDAARLRLVRRIAQLEEQVQVMDADLAALRATSLWQLKAMVDQAAVRGKDIVQDMVRRLKRDIMAATNRLDAMR